MTKTENYQLPQWEPHDPVRRTDFNAAMDSIDTALQDVSAAAASVDNRETTMARLRRMGYDLYQSAARSVCAGVPHITLKGSALNTLSNKEDVQRAGGAVALSEGGALLGPSTAMTMEKLNAAIYQWETVEAPEVVTPAAQRVKFKSGFSGTITTLNVWYHRNSASSVQLPIVVRLYDLESGECVYASPRIYSAQLTKETVTDTLNVAIPIEPNRDYQLELYTSGGTFYGTIGFGTYGTQYLTGTITAAPLTNAEATETLTVEGPMSQVVAVIHHSGGQVMGAAVNGTAMSAQSSRDGYSLRGCACTEQEFFWEGTLTGTANLTANFQATSADMTIYDLQFFCI